MSKVYEFGPFLCDPHRRLLERGGASIPLSGRAFEILAALLEHRGEVVDKDTLMKLVWPDTAVEENNLTVNMSWLRKALGETPADPQYILTITGRGYRFIADVSIREPGEPKPQPRAARIHRSAIYAPAAAILIIAIAGFFWNKSHSPKRPVSAANTIAVLPFHMLGSDPSNAYLGSGLTDALITRLTNLRGIAVRPMSSVLRLADKDPFAAGRELGADAVLDGKVQRFENKIRVTVQMLRVKDGASLWAATFDENLTSLFALEDSISARVTASLAPSLRAADVSKRNTRNPEAYQNYLRGRYYASRYTEEGYRKGVDYLNQAIAADPGYALAYSGLADAYYDASNMLFPPREAMSKAKAAAQRAVEIDPALAEAHVSLGIVASKFDWDWPAAQREFQTALDLNPNLASAHLWYALYRAALGDLDKAVQELRRSQELDPLSTDSSGYLGTVLYWSRKYDTAIEQSRKVIEFDPNYFPAYVSTAWALEALGRPLEAVTACEKARAIVSTPWTEAALARAAALAGKRDQALETIQSLNRLSRDRFVSGYDIAAIYAALGQKDEAFAWLEKAYDQRAEWLEYLKIDPQLDNLRSDPRFAVLLRRLALDR